MSCSLLLQCAADAGFCAAGVVAAHSPATYPAFEQYIADNYHGSMTYLAQQQAARRYPDSVLPGVQSLIMLGVSYATVAGSALPDYHGWCRQQLKLLSAKHRELFPAGQCRGVVDTAPLMEKYFAAEAGLGFIGKNTLLIMPEFGSRVFLAALLSSERFPAASVKTETLCGDCQKCLDACPTGALVAPYTLDARKCRSYWSIEIPRLNGRIGNTAEYGCEICQQVCPYNTE